MDAEAVEPATATTLVALLAVIREYGPLGLGFVAAFFFLRSWRAGEFLPKATHDAIVEATRQRYLDMLERYKASQDGLLAWRESAERAARGAEATQADHQAILTRLAEMLRELEELRDDLRDRERDPPPPTRRPAAGGDRGRGV